MVYYLLYFYSVKNKFKVCLKNIKILMIKKYKKIKNRNKDRNRNKKEKEIK